MSEVEYRNVPTCNVTVAKSPYSAGSKAYLVNATGSESYEVLVRSRSGRWIRTWVKRAHLTNWRYTTVVPQSSAHKHLWFYGRSGPPRTLPVDWAGTS